MEHVTTGLQTSPRRLIVGITGASGAIYGVQLLEALHALQVETHLVITEAGCTTLALETGRTPESLEPLVARRYAPYDFTAAIASGSFQCHAMVVAPCSMRTLAAIAHGLADNLLTRAADVMLKERRRLVLICLLYTSDAADDLLCVDFGGRRILKKKKTEVTLTQTY